MGSVLWNAYTPSTFGCKSGSWERSLLLAGINPCSSRKAGSLCQGKGEPLLHTRHGSQPQAGHPATLSSMSLCFCGCFSEIHHCSQEMNFGVEQCPP